MGKLTSLDEEMPNKHQVDEEDVKSKGDPLKLIDKAIALVEVKDASPQHKQAVAKLRAAAVLIRVG